MFADTCIICNISINHPALELLFLSLLCLKLTLRRAVYTCIIRFEEHEGFTLKLEAKARGKGHAYVYACSISKWSLERENI